MSTCNLRRPQKRRKNRMTKRCNMSMMTCLFTMRTIKTTDNTMLLATRHSTAPANTACISAGRSRAAATWGHVGVLRVANPNPTLIADGNAGSSRKLPSHAKQFTRRKTRRRPHGLLSNPFPGFCCAGFCCELWFGSLVIIKRTPGPRKINLRPPVCRIPWVQGC